MRRWPRCSKAESPHPVGVLRSGGCPGCGRQEFRQRQQVAAGHRLHRRRQQPCPHARRSELNRVVGDLVSHRAPVIAFGVGPQIQRQLLGILAARTGGVVVPELSNVDADAYGRLARAVHGSVSWPTAPVKWPGAMTVYAKTCPPLRSDRDTVVVGTTKSTGPAQVEIAVDGPAGPQTLKWDIPQWTPDDHNSYLATLVKQAEAEAPDVALDRSRQPGERQAGDRSRRPWIGGTGSRRPRRRQSGGRRHVGRRRH